MTRLHTGRILSARNFYFQYCQLDYYRTFGVFTQLFTTTRLLPDRRRRVHTAVYDNSIRLSVMVVIRIPHASINLDAFPQFRFRLLSPVLITAYDCLLCYVTRVNTNDWKFKYHVHFQRVKYARRAARCPRKIEGKLIFLPYFCLDEKLHHQLHYSLRRKI